MIFSKENTQPELGEQFNLHPDNSCLLGHRGSHYSSDALADKSASWTNEQPYIMQCIKVCSIHIRQGEGSLSPLP